MSVGSTDSSGAPQAGMHFPQSTVNVGIILIALFAIAAVTAAVIIPFQTGHGSFSNGNRF